MKEDRSKYEERAGIRRKAKEALRQRIKELTCFYAVSHDIRENISIDELCRRTVEYLVLAMRFPEIAVSVIELNGKRFTSENYTEGLSQSLHGKIRVEGEAIGRLSVYYVKEGSLFTPEEQNLINDIAEAFSVWLGHKRAEEALKESEERYRRLVESSPYGIAIHSEGKLVYMNLAGGKILGTANPDEIVGKKLLQIIHPDYHEIAKNRVRMQEEGNVAPPLEEKFLRLDGTPVDVEITSIPFTYMGKLGMYGVFRDITERRKAEESRIENLRLETANKAKSEFLAAMSHELRTPLNAIIGFSDVLSLEIGGSLNEKQKDYVNDIHNAGEHLLLIINDILDLSKVEAGEMDLVLEKFTVNELLEETITLIKNKAIKNHIDIIRDIDPQLEFIEGDKTKVKQVLFNLLSNAVKFSREVGGTLTIKANKEGDMAQISVSDTGIGIKEENVSKLFHKFEQLGSGITRKYGGTGLGLAITKQLVELHGGRIWVESRYGERTTFTFLLPIEAKKEEI